jgi:hypothetical protein
MRGAPAAFALVVLALLAGCQTVPPAPPPPTPLALTDPGVERALYLLTDSATFQVDPGPAGVMSVATSLTATVLLESGRQGAFVEARLEYLRLRGSLRTAVDAPAVVDEGAVSGPFHVRVDPRGQVEIVSRPALSPALLDVVGAESMVRPLFVHLPGHVVEPGEAWVDTVTVVAENDGVRSVTRTVLTTTLVGDTMVEGRTLLLLHTRAENRIETDGRSGGVTVRQRLQGETLGTVVWDPWLQLLIGRREEGELTGTLRLGDTERDLPVSARVRRSVELER